jgi:hypothetical protein
MSEWAREVLLRELEGRQARPADETLLAVGGATTGLAFADAAGETTNIAIHGVEVVPVLGNFVSAVATVKDIFGKEGVISSYKACLSGGH